MIEFDDDFYIFGVIVVFGVSIEICSIVGWLEEFCIDKYLWVWDGGVEYLFMVCYFLFG